ncbi:MAG: hypothetical protein GIW98_02135 [Candidatus Eremiobacteraeota bacterium]|nr:hypothetical protein [Candidatus Eremiobacteraeota bacterium]
MKNRSSSTRHGSILVADEMVNLLVDLRDERFSATATQDSLDVIEHSGYSVEQPRQAPPAMLAWLDDEFGGTWSSEAYAGRNIIVKCADKYAGFVTYDPHGLKFSWLAQWRSRKDTGIFGPFGVSRPFRGSVIGPNLLRAALGKLRETGYDFALVPAVSPGALTEYYMKQCGAKIVERFAPHHFASRRFKTTVLASGNGTNFQAVLDAVAKGVLALDITALVANHQDAFALQRAQAAGVKPLPLCWSKPKETRATYDLRLIDAVEKTGPELVLLLGWMHLLPASFVGRFPQMINIHPAFLPHDQSADTVTMPDGRVIPAYRGARALRDALADRSPWVGATCHRVTEEADRGPVLARKPLAVESHAAEEVMARLLRPIEHRVLLGGITRWVLEQPNAMSLLKN